MKYVVTGRALPERADISFGRCQLQLPEGGLVVASCDSSQFTVVLDVPNIDGWVSAYILGTEIAGIILASLGFALGTGYSVEALQVTEEDGTPHVFGVRPQGLAPGEYLSIEPTQPNFNSALNLAMRDVFFRLAVQDYVRAIKETADCATYCYRAIEAIKSSFVLKTGLDRWEDMHQALGTNRDEIVSTVKSFADPVRHGNWASTKSTNSLERWKMLWLTRNILVKYLAQATVDDTKS